MTYAELLAAAREELGLVRVVHAPIGRGPIVVRTAEGHLIRGYLLPVGYQPADSEYVWTGRPVDVGGPRPTEAHVGLPFGDRH